MSTVVFDIADRHLAALTRDSQDAIIGIAADGAIVSWNPAAERLLGYAADEVLGQSVLRLLPGPEHSKRSLLDRLDDGESARRFVIHHASRDGLPLDLSVSVSPVHVDDALAGAWAIVRDVSGSLAVQESIRQDLEAYRLAFASSPMPMWIYDLSTLRIIAANTAACDRYGYSRDELCRLTVDLLHPTSSRGRFQHHVEQHADEATTQLPIRHITADGQLLDVRVSAHPLRLATGPARLVLAEDISSETAAKRAAATAQRQLGRALTATIGAIATTVDKRDPYTAGHCQRVAEIATGIATRMGLTAHDVQGIQLAATIHDIGKIAIPTDLLTYPGPLTGPALELVRTHSQVGHDIIAGIRFPWPIAKIILQHHERLDGSGYPSGLKRNAILPQARIVAVADVVEAMSSHRPYRAKLGLDAALTELHDGRGIRYDPDAVDACLELYADEPPG